MDYLQKAKGIMGSYSGKATDLQEASVYAAIAQADRMDKLIAKLDDLADKVAALSTKAEEAGKAVAKVAAKKAAPAPRKKTPRSRSRAKNE